MLAKRLCLSSSDIAGMYARTGLCAARGRSARFFCFRSRFMLIVRIPCGNVGTMHWRVCIVMPPCRTKQLIMKRESIIALLLLACCLPGMGMTRQPDGGGGGYVTVSNEEVTATEILNFAGPQVYYAGIRELSLESSFSETVVRLDTALGAKYVYFQSNEGLCLEVANEHGCLTLTDTGSAPIIGQNQHIAIRLDPDTPPTGDICWLVFDASKQPYRVSTGNNEPFVLECSIPGLTNRGVVASPDDLGVGEVGLLFGGVQKPEGAATAYTFATLSVVARIPQGAPAPEPAGGMLSLLSLAILSARRRRC